MVDSATGAGAKFVDNRVDPLRGASVSFGLPEGASGIRSLRDHIKEPGTHDGRFGRFFARPRRGPFGET